MDPGTGRFTSVDPEDGCIECGLSQHKYQYANLSPVSKSDPTGRFTLSMVMATVSVSNILSAQPAVSIGQISYKVGLCVRNVAGISQKIDAVVPDHHNVKVGSYFGKSSSSFQITSVVRGFFADDFWGAIAEAINPFSSTGGWVPGHVDTDANPGNCKMVIVSKQRYATVLQRILTTDRERPYHLRIYNCTHWAAEQLR